MAIKDIKRRGWIAAKLKAARVFKFGTVAGLAAASGLSTQAVISGERQGHNPTIATILAICETTGMPVAWLVDDHHRLPMDWEEVVSAKRITGSTRLPVDAPWKDYSGLLETFALKPHHASRLKILCGRLGIGREALIHQLINEGLAIKEAQFETVTKGSLDVDLLRELAEICDQIELDEQQWLSRDEKNKIIKSLYFELESKGLSASDISLAEISRIT